jgi:ribosomal protein L29
MKRKEQLDQLQRNGLSKSLNDQADALKESLFRLKFRKALGVGETISDIRRERSVRLRAFTQ